MVSKNRSGSPWAPISMSPPGLSPRARSTLRVVRVTRTYDTASNL